MVLKHYLPFFTAAALLGLVLLCIYPYYQYYIDPDGVAYLTVARRYATGDMASAINGYWSPLSCWLIALLLKAGCLPIPAAVIVNAIAAIGFLFISQSFFLKFNISTTTQWLLGFTLSLFLCFAVFWQLFADLWGDFFLLCALRVFLHPRFSSVPALWATAGALGALAYFSKAYALPFFLLSAICVTYRITQQKPYLWLRMCGAIFSTLFVISIPWLWFLHNKYQDWTTGTAGALNLSWYLIGHPFFKPGVHLLLPPVYPDSPYYWEDPWVVNGPAPHFWDSPHLFSLQLVRIGYNVMKLFTSLNELSSFAVLSMLMATGVLWSARVRKHVGEDLRLPAMCMLLFPLGYLLINFESRYLWYLLPLCMILLARALQSVAASEKKWLVAIMHAVVLVSFLIFPAWKMKDMYREGQAEYALSQYTKAHSISGSFTSNSLPGEETQRIVRYAWFSGNAYYSTVPTDSAWAALLPEMRAYHVRYYVHLQHGMDDAHFQLKDEQGRDFPEVTGGEIRGVRIFQVE
jgi:hypothetical protein